nr:TPA_asm: M37.5 uORF 2 [Murid betaherpesvirus 1]DBA07963.1 TPA_asm: M37.5 uORF 2 [Murid betaherpesvirus 1]
MEGLRRSPARADVIRTVAVR